MCSLFTFAMLVAKGMYEQSMLAALNAKCTTKLQGKYEHAKQGQGPWLVFAQNAKCTTKLQGKYEHAK